MAEDRTLGQLVAEASRDLSELVRHEVALAKAEIKVSAKEGATVGGLFGAAGYFAFAASILIFIAAAYGLMEAGLQAWAAFLIVAGVLLLLAALLALIGRARTRKIGPPERTIRTTKETIAAVRPGTPAR
jgi:hypothetical protein